MCCSASPQFEREVTGERIRDKIAASKAKGLWMGGYPPLGYDAPADVTRVLHVNESEASTVRRIFERYLELGTVKLLAEWLEAEDIRPKQWTASSGRKIGAGTFSRSALYYLLRNPIYRGMIRHKSAIHPGGHRAIVDAKLFDGVQRRLDQAARRSKMKGKSVAKAVLHGRIFDATGRPMTATSSHGKGRRVYRYYATKKDNSRVIQAGIQRIPGLAIEHQLRSILERLMPAREGGPLDRVRRVEIQASTIIVLIEASVGSGLTLRLIAGETAAVDFTRRDWLRLEVPLRIRNRRARTSIQLAQEPETCFDGVMISALRRAHGLINLNHQRLPMLTTAPRTFYERRLVRLAFLAPDLQAAILEGRQPAHLSLEQLIERPIPIDWEEQRAIFRLDSARSKLRHRSEVSTLAAAMAAANR
jgi:hypothetical protein